VEVDDAMNTPTDRLFAIMLLLDAVDRAGTSTALSRAQGWLALRTLGVTGNELNDALRELGQGVEP
jgi:hypothetical protein